jgi:hypothetical protein
MADDPLTCAASKLPKTPFRKSDAIISRISIADLSRRLMKYIRADSKTARRFR